MSGKFNSWLAGFFCSLLLHIIFFSLLFIGEEKEKEGKKITWVSLVEKPTPIKEEEFAPNKHEQEQKQQKEKQQESFIQPSRSGVAKQESNIKQRRKQEEKKWEREKIGKKEGRKEKSEKSKKSEKGGKNRKRGKSEKREEGEDSESSYERKAKEILKETISRVADLDVVVSGSGIESDYESDPIFLEYVKKLWKKVTDNWYIPRQLFEFECVISVEIEQDGSVRQYIIEKTSGNSVFDSLAVSAIRRSEPFSPLPPNMSRVEIGFRFKGSEGKTY